MSKNWLHDPVYFAPEIKLGGGYLCLKSSPSPPPAPDYTGAANATAAGNLENLRAQTEANRYNQYTPYGNQTWAQPDRANSPDRWESSIQLDPRIQQTLDTQLAASNQAGNMSQAAGERTQAAFDQPFDQQSVDDVYNRSYETQTARLDPQWQQNEKMFDAKLANQGVMQGSEAYNNAARTFGQQRNDAYTQARQAAISTMPQTYQLATATRNQPLNEWNAIRTGAQIQNPTFSQGGQQGVAQGPNYSQAAAQQYGGALNMYNADVGSANSFNSGLFGLASSGLGAYGAFLAASDRRLKRNIKRIGSHPRGFGIYEYDIFGRHEIGVMAQEVQPIIPEAVITLPSGYMAVNYGML